MILQIQNNGSALSPDREVVNVVGATITDASGQTKIDVSTVPAATAVTAAAGAGSFDYSSATGIFKTSTGANTLSGDTTLATGKKLVPSATGGIDPAVAGFTAAWTCGTGVLLATAGNDNACTNGDVYWAPIFIPCNTTITGIAYLIGSVGGTDKVIAALYSSTGTLLANSALAGATVGTAANMQAVDFTATYAAKGPALYYVALQFNGTTAKFRTHTIPGMKFVTGSVAGTFGTLAAITPGTTYTANKAPIAVTY